MLFADHLRYGFIASVATAGAYSLIAPQIPELSNDPDSIAIAFGACLAGSLAPDLDTNSRPSKYFSMFLFLFGLWSIWNRELYPFVIFATAFAFIKSMNHRTFCHIFALPMILSISAVYFSIWWLIPFSVGLICHYICDRLNPLKLNNWWKPLVIW